MGKFKDLTGHRFGRLTVIEPTKERKNGAVVWKCKCSCGNICFVSRANLEQGYVRSCGCLKSEQVAERSRARQTKDLTGQKFGRLTAVRPTEKRNNEYIVWECRCDCGNTTYVNSNNLVSGDTLSCGCLNSEKARANASKNIAKFREKNYVAGTRLDVIGNNKPNKNSTTGIKGVYLRKKDGRYTAHIEFQGKRYFLGSYPTKEEAAQARKQAENKLYGDFLQWYNSTYKDLQGKK